MNNSSREYTVEQIALRLILNSNRSIVVSTDWQDVLFAPFGSIAIFVSSSTEKGQKLKDLMAKKSLETDQAILKNYVISVGKAIGIDLKVKPSIGSWDDGVEEGVVVQLPITSNYDSVKWLAAMIGREFRQKCVIVYNDTETGDNIIYRLQFNNTYTIQEIDNTLSENGIVNKTIVTHNNTFEAIILDENVEIFDSIHRVKCQHDLPLAFYRGRADFLGYYDEAGLLDDKKARDKSGEVYNQIINSHI